MNNGQKPWWDRAVGAWILSRWSGIAIIISALIVLGTSIYGALDPESARNNSPLLFSFLFVLISFLILTALEIRHKVSDIHYSTCPKNEADSISFRCYQDMNAAQNDIFDKLFKHMSQTDNTAPVVLRIYGMRLTYIAGLIPTFLSRLLDKNVNTRRLVVKIYHCNPAFLRTIQISDDIENSLRERTKQSLTLDAATLENIIQELQMTAVTNNNIELQFRQYSFIPSFWAYEIDRKDVFWGYITWNQTTARFEGPPHKCYYFNNQNEPVTDICAAINEIISAFVLGGESVFSSFAATIGVSGNVKPFTFPALPSFPSSVSTNVSGAIFPFLARYFSCPPVTSIFSPSSL